MTHVYMIQALLPCLFDTCDIFLRVATGPSFCGEDENDETTEEDVKAAQVVKFKMVSLSLQSHITLLTRIVSKHRMTCVIKITTDTVFSLIFK